RKDSNLQPLVCRTSAPSVELLGHTLVVGVGIEPTFRVFQTRANPSQLSDRLERAVRLELTNTGFAIQRLSHLATRAIWNGRRDSNSRDEFGRLACFQLHHFREESLPQRGTKNTE